MQHLDTIWKAMTTISQMRDMAVERKTYQFMVPNPVTLYLHSEHAVVQVSRWSERRIEIDMHLQAGFSWRVQTDQDEAGVYLVAVRRTPIGAIGQATFTVLTPYDTHLAIRLDDGSVLLNNVSGVLQVPPQTAAPPQLNAPTSRAGLAQQQEHRAEN